MRHGFSLTTLLVLCAGSLLAADKDDKKPDVEKLISQGKLAGVLTNTGGSEADYTIRVTLHTVQPNLQAQADLLRKQQQLVQRQAQIMSNRNPWQRQQQLVQLVRDAQQVPQNLFTVKEVQEDIHALPADNMKVRLLRPPDAFDTKGNIKKYTAKELRELKGPDDLPGYTGTLDDVKTNQVVLVYLARKPAKPGDKPKDPERTREGDRVLDKDKDRSLVIRMIVVLGDKK